MRLGFHLSIAGSLSLALRQARTLGCQALQIFVQNPRQWQWRPVPAAQIREFVTARRELGIGPLAVHLGYLPNLAAGEARLYRRSRERLLKELALARELEADFLVCHPGHALPEEGGLVRAARALAQAVAQVPPPPLVLLENTAGQGRELGWRLSQLGDILERSAVPLGLCLDTAHAYAAGYDIRRRAGVNRLLGEIAQGPGVSRIKLIHLNDSRGGLGSRVDRHQQLGQGNIGLEGFREFFSHPLINPAAVIMETPRRHRADEWYNLLVARTLMGQSLLRLN
jgi:deoxyribonuclease-4